MKHDQDPQFQELMMSLFIMLLAIGICYILATAR